MAEYYAVLSKAVAGLDASSPEARRAVYDKARNALIGQLKAIDPPLPTVDISRQRLELEEAIRRVEREALSVPAGAARVARSAVAEPAASTMSSSPPPAAPARAPSPAPATPLRRSPQDVFRRAIQDAEKDTAEEEPQLERAPAVAAKVDTSWASERIDRVPPPARPQQSYLPSHGYVEKEVHSDEPRLAPDYDQEWDQTAPGLGGVAAPMGEEDRTAKARRGRRGARGSHDAMETSVRSSRLPSVLLLVLILAMLGGLGALAWSQRDILADLAAGIVPSSGTETPTTSEAATAAAVPAGDDAAGKDTESLLSGGETPPGEDVRVVEPADGDPIGAQVASTAPGAATTSPADQTSDLDALVAQRAVLYEEPLDAEAAAAGVVAINAAVTWSYLPDGINGPEIVGRIDVPERGLKVKLAIRRNTDQTLPASHIVEVVVDAPGDFPGQGVRDVPRIVFKPSEDARGQPLIGASARVADGFFWIALSGVDSDVRVNQGLLRERIWIDLPLVYETGQRAILTLEKGAPGERVFERALVAWTG